MKLTETAAMVPLATGNGRKLLVGHVTTAIEAGDVLVLVRGDGDRYRLLRASTDPGDQNDPATLGSFLAPEEVDHSELAHAIAIADEASRPTRQPAKKRKVTRR